jgi:Rrf2 family protein
MILLWYHLFEGRKPMKLITRDTDYALRAICFIAQSKRERVPVDELVKKLQMPRPFLRKILQRLNKSRLLKSYKGQDGGFRLLKKPQEIFLLHLIRIFQGPLKLNECSFKKMLCPNSKTCALRKKIDKIERHILKELRTITMRDLLKEKR